MDKGFITVRNHKIIRKVYTEDIDYILQVNRKLRIVCSGEAYEYYDKLINVEKYLGSDFYRNSKYLYINLARVDAMYERCIEFSDGEILNISRDGFVAAKQVYSTYLKYGREK